MEPATIIALLVFAGILIIVLLVLISNIKIVPQSKAYVVERLGTYKPHGRQDSTVRYRLSIL